MSKERFIERWVEIEENRAFAMMELQDIEAKVRSIMKKVA